MVRSWHLHAIAAGLLPLLPALPAAVAAENDCVAGVGRGSAVKWHGCLCGMLENSISPPATTGERAVTSVAGRHYFLESSTNLQNRTTESESGTVGLAGTGASLILRDLDPIPGKNNYRVRVELQVAGGSGRR